MSDAITIDASRFNASVTRFALELRRNAPIVIKDQVRKFLKLVIRFTPPKTLNQGKKAVKRDITRAMELIEPRRFRNRDIRRIIQTRNYPAFDALMVSTKFFGGRRAGWELVRFDEALHKKVRNRRGRVTKSQKKWTMDAFKLKGYIRRVQARVGRMKAGWLPAYELAGGTDAPGYVQGHRGANPPGYVVNNLATPGNPSVTIGNTAAGITQDPDTSRRIRDALRIRVKNMGKDMARIIRDQKQKVGFN